MHPDRPGREPPGDELALLDVAGSSWAIMFVSSGEWNERYPRLETKSAARLSTSRMSACRVTAHSPFVSSRYTGSLARIHVYAACGSWR